MAQQHLIKFVEDPAATDSREIGFLFASSYDEAVSTAEGRFAEFKAKGANGYRIEDQTGRTVWIGPGTHDIR